MTTTALIRKSFDGITKVVDETQGLVEAIVNTTGLIDLQNDLMEPGAWDGLCKSMSAGEVDYPSVLWSHDWSVPVGKVVHAEELMPGDARLVKTAKGNPAIGGLRIIAQYNLDTQRGREAYSDVSKGVIKQWSVGFMPDDTGHSYDRKGVHVISKVGIWPEVSNVLVGASPGTRTTATKSAEEILTDTALTVHEKAIAIEQAYLAAVEDGDGLPVLEKLIEGVPVITWAAPEPPQPQAEVTTAEANLDLEALEARLLQMVTERLNAPTQHSDPEPDSGDDGLPYWAYHNVALPLIHPDKE